MKLLTRQQLADGAAEAFKACYTYNDGLEHDGEWRSVPRVASRYKALLALGEHPDPDEVNRVAEHPLVNLRCDECGDQNDVVFVGAVPDGESADDYREACICQQCAQAACALFDRASGVSQVGDATKTGSAPAEPSPPARAVQQSFWNFRRTFKTFMCAECGGEVKLRYGPGRKMELYRGVPELELDDKFPLPTCEKCGEVYTSGDMEDALQEQLQGAFDRLVWKRLNLLEAVVLLPTNSGFLRCDKCGQPATRKRLTSDEDHTSVYHCDKCRPEMVTTELGQAAIIRSLDALRRGDD